MLQRKKRVSREKRAFRVSIVVLTFENIRKPAPRLPDFLIAVSSVSFSLCLQMTDRVATRLSDSGTVPGPRTTN
jgi:hypothetical protein